MEKTTGEREIRKKQIDLGKMAIRRNLVRSTFGEQTKEGESKELYNRFGPALDLFQEGGG